MTMGFFVDNENCYGCKTCAIACKSDKRLGEGVLLRTINTFVQKDPRALSFLSMGCNHCDEPACLATCPVDAYTKLENGIVVQDNDTCIGCKSCIEACPYNAPSYDEALSKVFKCDMCIDRQRQGLDPACVSGCPGKNIFIGEMDELSARENADVISDPEVLTVPNFVLAVDPKLLDSPEKLIVLDAAAK